MSINRESRTRACLFGGVLFAAGIAGADASGQTFAFQYHYHRVVGTGPNTVFLAPYAYGPFGVGDTVYIKNDFSAYVSCTNTAMSFMHDRASNAAFSYTSVEVVAYFYALEEMDVRVQWDAGAWATRILTVQDLTAGTTLLNGNASATGDQTIHLAEDHQHLAVLLTRGTSPGGASWALITIENQCVADVNADGVLNLDDIAMFADSFIGGCP
ncbi:MAG: hypothetical protein R3B49_10535 [Phycisphaerales bacterium]